MVSVVAAVAAGMVTATTAGAVSGGTAVADGADPFAARIVADDGAAGCSGALVAPDWVITAKRCFGENVVEGPPPRPARVSLGPKVPAPNPGDILVLPTVTRLVPHPDRDVVLALLARRPGSPAVPAVPIATGAPAAGEQLRVAGFGRTATEWVPGRLTTAPSAVQGVTAASVDFAVAGGDPCKGDAGAPVLRERGGQAELVAVTSTSWQRGCLAETGTRGGATATRVDDLGAWIKDKTTPLTADPARLKFADLDGDGRAERILVHPDGTVHARRNTGGFGPSPWGFEDVVIATGFAPDRTLFADLDGDRRAEILSVFANGEVHAWHNSAGFAPMPWDREVVVATGFGEP
ncbi:trypsin-like serine protease, partial [Amycolatopsis sp.]|uniref:trypsin-like serine protease n=1 Tax=Amycolatopsis sp. TaxID=37632 RepID=UPI002D807BA8